MIIFKTELIRSEGYKDRIKQVDVETIINTFLQEMSQCMIVGDDIVLRGFGKFMSKIRKARTKYNSICKTELTFPERRFIKFNISKRIDKHIKGEEGHE